jgi:predicted DsbA family dithiol-disulfide isomerase
MPLGIPLPAIGLAGFLAIGVVSVVSGRRARAVQLALSAAAALAGAGLLVVQAKIGSFCVYCSVADASAIATVVVAGWWMRRSIERIAPAWAPWAGAGAMALAASVPLTIGFVRKNPALPAPIAAEIARTPEGHVTVVDFVDFECPFCRSTNAVVSPLFSEHADRLRVVRRQVPLRSHEHAFEAARAACCGEKLGKGDAMATALFSAPVEELTREGCERLAREIGIALDPFRACVSDPRTDEQIEADRAEFKAAGGRALPTIWIGREELEGAQPSEAYEKALDDALSRAGG